MVVHDAGAAAMCPPIVEPRRALHPGTLALATWLVPLVLHSRVKGAEPRPAQSPDKTWLLHSANPLFQVRITCTVRGNPSFTKLLFVCWLCPNMSTLRLRMLQLPTVSCWGYLTQSVSPPCGFHRGFVAVGSVLLQPHTRPSVAA